MIKKTFRMKKKTIFIIIFNLQKRTIDENFPHSEENSDENEKMTK